MSAKSQEQCAGILLVTDRILRKETLTTTMRQSNQLHEFSTTSTTRRIGQYQVGSWQLSHRTKDGNEAYEEWEETTNKAQDMVSCRCPPLNYPAFLPDIA